MCTVYLIGTQALQTAAQDDTGVYLIGTQALQTAAQHGAGHPVNDKNKQLRLRLRMQNHIRRTKCSKKVEKTVEKQP